MWNRAGSEPDGIGTLTRAARVVKPDAVVWRGDPLLPVHQQGLKVLGIPIGQPSFVVDFLESKSRTADPFPEDPVDNDPQAVYLLLLMCASTRANFWLRSVRRDQTQEFAARHDDNVWSCSLQILGMRTTPSIAHVFSTLALSVGDLGLANAIRVRVAAHSSSWADSLRMIKQRHPLIADFIVAGLADGPVPCFQAVRECELSDSPPTREEDPEPNQPKFGWQQKATRMLEKNFIDEVVWPGLDNASRALFRSHHGPLAFAVFTAFPTSRVRVDAQPFRLLLCRRLHLPLPLSMRTCRCGRQLDMFGHHRAACAMAGVLGRRGHPLECAAAQVCKEAGARVSTNVRVRDLDLADLNVVDGRRLEVVADGLSLWHGAQLAIDTTWFPPLHNNGSARRRAADHDGAALEVARRRQEHTYRELVGEGGRARLVVLVAEDGAKKLPLSSLPWPKRALNLLLSFCRAGSKLL